MDLLLDVNIVLDICQPRPEHLPAALKAISQCRREGGRMFTAEDPEDEQLLRALERFHPGTIRLLTRDIPAYALMTGVPARRIGWMSRHGERLELPLKGKGRIICPHGGVVYTLSGETITITG